MTSWLRAYVRSTVPVLDVDLTLDRGQTVAVLGPNGAGKSTLLAMLAGLLRPDPGSSIVVGDRVLVGDGEFVAPHRRGVALLAQDARLFPHLTVRRNVGFAPAAQHLSRPVIRERVDRWLELTGVAEFAERKPAQLSGGQAQRVGFARALAAEPQLLLLDEPFSALDVEVAARVRGLLRPVLADRDRTTVLVTHDIVDAVMLCDRVVVMDAGRIVAAGPTREVLASPVDHFTARLAGLNLIVGRWDGERVEAAGVGISGTPAPHDVPARGGGATAVFAPAAVGVYVEHPTAGSPRNVITASVTEIVPAGDRAVAHCRAGDTELRAEITWAAVDDLGLAAGNEVFLVVKASEVQVHPTAGARPPDP
ncbi:sulfate/molybdate ABC transporter ATP-binding protein [Williamsia sterculiae]|uniref:Molybdate transport system ATP-binding protein n=1 Tax=Williamsia sterculiae TaxID=1344003 RepID=A0A1N7CB18_9NOCA|nr:ATP-binding cassette domain-containing protein [Williamsia sterculiae]SIR60808.1 molybdate transport system ATP-binding protein [Williamsia sterculiae]